MRHMSYIAFLLFCLPALLFSQCKSFHVPPSLAKVTRGAIFVHPNLPGGGGTPVLRCLAVHKVSLTVVKGNDMVVVTPNHVSAEVGECVEWNLVSDGNTGSIELIDFIDTAAEAPAGKSVNSQPIGDYCLNAGKTCTMYVGIQKPYPHTYTYTARVLHDNKHKKADPELEATCDGCGDY